jgi:hypothetical protein
VGRDNVYPPKRVILNPDFFDSLRNLREKVWKTHSRELRSILNSGEQGLVDVLGDVLKGLAGCFESPKRYATSSKVAGTVLNALPQILDGVQAANSPPFPFRNLLRASDIERLVHFFNDPERLRSFVGLFLRGHGAGAHEEEPADASAEAVQCSICLGDIAPGRAVACIHNTVPHLFHSECYATFRRLNPLNWRCPNCNRDELDLIPCHLRGSRHGTRRPGGEVPVIVFENDRLRVEERERHLDALVNHREEQNRERQVARRRELLPGRGDVMTLPGAGAFFVLLLLITLIVELILDIGYDLHYLDTYGEGGLALVRAWRRRRRATLAHQMGLLTNAFLGTAFMVSFEFVTRR